MPCSKCNILNDADAVFCSECGSPLVGASGGPRANGRRIYFFALLLIPVIAAALGAGYYKDILPQGIVATVNGEEITLAELEAAVGRAQPPYAEKTGDEQAMQRARGLRYQVLDGLIMEKLVLQEARKAGVTVDSREAETSVEQSRQASGMDKKAFDAAVVGRYGSRSSFVEEIRRQLQIRKFLAGNIVPRGAGSKAAAEAVDRWMQNIYARAAVRITLAEQLSGASGGCCNGKEFKSEHALHVRQGR